MWIELRDQLDTIIEELADAPAATSDKEQVLRVDLANTLAIAARVLRALANDEELGK